MPNIDRALDLRPNSVGIDDDAAVDRANDAPNADRAVLRHFDLRDHRHVACEGVLDRDAAADARRKLLPPAGLFGGERQDRLGARCLVEERAADRRPDPASPRPPVHP